MIDETMMGRLRELVFDGAGRAGVFAVLDGAMVEQLPARLAASDCDHACLFSGDLDPVLEEAAPHLVHLRRDNAFSDVVLRLGWNDHWGVVLHPGPDMDLYAVRQHLRRHLRVLDAGGNPMFFRFYDPRVFRMVVPQLDARARRDFFGPFRRYFVESARENEVLCFDAGSGGKVRNVDLAAATDGI